MEELIARAVEACQRGSLDALQTAIEEGVSPDAQDDDGCSLLHWAAINNRIPIVQRLLDLGAEPNIIGGLLVSSPLHWACRVGHTSSSALLVKAGAVCNIRDTQGYTPIHLAVQSNQSALVAYLLEKFHYCKNITDNSGMTPLMWAAYRTFGMFPIRLIIRGGANLNAQEHLSGNTALHIATQERNYIAIRELLNGGADVFLRNKQQESPLDIARNMRNRKILDMFDEAATAQRRQPMPWFCTLPWKKIKHVAGFFLPGLMLCMAAFLFYSLHHGVAATVLLVMFLVSQCFMRLDLHSASASLVPIGVCVAEPVAMIITWCMYVHWFVSWWMQIAFFITMLALFMSLAKVVFSDPGVIIRNVDSHADFVRAVEQCEQVNYCFTCWVDKPEGAKHCGVCDRCVLDFDHHCPWLHQCITSRNLRVFLMFVACVAISAAIYSCALIMYIIEEAHRLSIGGILNDHSWLVFSLTLSVLHVVMLSALFFNQCMQISENVMTVDRIRSARARYQNRSSFDGSQSTPSSAETITFATRMHNIADFCGRSS